MVIGRLLRRESHLRTSHKDQFTNIILVQRGSITLDDTREWAFGHQVGAPQARMTITADKNLDGVYGDQDTMYASQKSFKLCILTDSLLGRAFFAPGKRVCTAFARLNGSKSGGALASSRVT